MMLDGSYFAPQEVALLAREMLAPTTPRERRLMELRLQGDSLLEAGESLGVSRERARQILWCGFARIRDATRESVWDGIPRGETSEKIRRKERGRRKQLERMRRKRERGSASARKPRRLIDWPAYQRAERKLWRDYQKGAFENYAEASDAARRLLAEFMFMEAR